VLSEEGFTDVDPSHPLGGPDGGKDITCTKDGKKWIAAVYFPRGQKKFISIKNKFKEDLTGADKNEASGVVFVTNQELSLSQRESLKNISGSVEVDLGSVEIQDSHLS
jgi:hypothetical protein